MILSGLKIQEYLHNKIHIEPYDSRRLNANSYNLRLHNSLLTYTQIPLDMKKKPEAKRILIPEEGFEMQPGVLYLGRTIEYTKTYDLVPMLEGRSSVGRLGLFVHVTAGFGDVGFEGYWTLELFCVHPIRIYPNIEICQIFYHTIEGDHRPYFSTKYQKNTDVQISLLYKEFKHD